MSAQAQTHYHPPSTATPTASSSSLPYHQPTTLEEIRTLWIGSIIASLTLVRFFFSISLYLFILPYAFL
ncbi:hypothetical protein CsSME_00032672 [Camellia sinensis var. sinensis]